MEGVQQLSWQMALNPLTTMGLRMRMQGVNRMAVSQGLVSLPFCRRGNRGSGG